MSVRPPPSSDGTHPPSGPHGRAFQFQQAPGHLIRRAHQIAVAVFNDVAGAHAVTPVQFAILTALREQPAIDQITLAQRVAFDAATIGSVIGRLEKKGWLHRRASAADRRRKLLWLTDEGERAAAAMEPAVALAQRRILEPLTDAEQQQLAALLDKLITQHPRGAAT
ncbi:MarR family winged helix-turn-helix transcriptional regulator [Ottowia sp.]|uniref:MarR family winged helix-turn-helix transcriptional regulator n=1 Tax=Ottowia sp. TaxID=1898956 RepID=UPI002C6F82F9|nr:MarR family winged helix-turn-helix transcriptional regulator [Ottowia sp.]HOB65908.1 MarR family winged helix-turn-helix transcriptional regulator [Ottowia sp.]HPZ58174.1 MarR family winged helix-turn-helix transcriptional regulator [Ottowia sp.]HQD47749.1 MarR family winged helix-turn-helix transcriptional regulator [Ottowia sp.]